MLRRLCFFVANGLGGVRRSWTERLAQALERQGVSTALIDIPEDGLHQSHLHQILSLRPEMTCSFSPAPMLGKVFLCDYLKIPHLSMLVEPAIFNLALAKSAYSIVSCVDYFDCELFINAHCERVFFQGYSVSPDDLVDSSEEKIYDAVFLGHIADSSLIRERWRAAYPPEVCQVLERAVELTLGDDNTAFAQALVYAWRGSGLDPKGNDFVQLCREVEVFSRAVGSSELIKAVEGVKVHLFDVDMGLRSVSTDGEQQFKELSHVVVHPKILPEEAWRVLRQSKICLSTAHCFKHGAQAEIIYGLAAGALVIAGANKYLEVHFGEQCGVVPYLHGDWDHVNERIRYYLDHEEQRQSVVDSGRKMLALEHTWDVRAEELIKRSSEFWDAISSEHYVRNFDNPQ